MLRFAVSGFALLLAACASVGGDGRAGALGV